MNASQDHAAIILLLLALLGTVLLIGALLTIETAPLTFPADCGAYCTLKFPL